MQRLVFRCKNINLLDTYHFVETVLVYYVHKIYIYIYIYICNALFFSSSSCWTTPITSTTLVTVAASHSSFGNYTYFADSNGTITESQPALLTGMPCDMCFIEC